MNWQSLPWTELTIAVPLVGAGFVAMTRDRDAAWRMCLGFTLAALGFSVLPWLALTTNGSAQRWDPFTSFGDPLFAVDGLSAPLLPLVALLTFLTVLSSPRSEGTRITFGCLLAGEAVQLALFACSEPWLLAALLSLGALPPLVALALHRKPIRVYALHLGLFVALLLFGVAGLESMRGPASAALMLAILVRSGTVPAHLWVGDLF